MPVDSGWHRSRDAGAELTALIGGQHTRVRELFSEALSAPPPQRGSAFVELVRFLAMHEAAEQEALHVARHAAPDSSMGTTTAHSPVAAISAQRLREEDSAAGLLERLEAMDSTSGSFRIQLKDVEEAVLHHAEAEEGQEVPAFLSEASAAQIARVVAVMRRVEELADDRSAGALVPPGAGFATQLTAARRILGDATAD